MRERPRLSDFPWLSSLPNEAARMLALGELHYDPNHPQPFVEGPALSRRKRFLVRDLADFPPYYQARPWMHEEFAERLIPAMEEIARKNLKKLILTHDGIFNPRMSRTGRQLSMHAWGAAIDLNARQNPLHTFGLSADLTGSVWELVPVFARWGLYWGGWFGGNREGAVNARGCDPMHFEFGVVTAGYKLGSGVY